MKDKSRIIGLMLIISICLCLALYYYGEIEVIQESLDIDFSNAYRIFKHFNSRKIKIIDISVATEDAVAKIGLNFATYNIVSTEGNQYYLIIDKNSSGYVAILDKELNLVDGAIDSVMFPDHIYP